MRTPKQTEASRANGAKSKGPVSPQGKINSARNSTRHGMFADTIVLEAEDKAPFLELVNELMEEHQPCTRTETMLVETIAAARWRQDRIWGMQKIAFDYDVSSSAALAERNPLRAVLALRNSPESVRTHELLLRYEIALDRQISRALSRLHQLQDRNAKAKAPVTATPAVPESSPQERTQQPVEPITPALPKATPVAPVSRQPGTENPQSAHHPLTPARLPVGKAPARRKSAA